MDCKLAERPVVVCTDKRGVCGTHNAFACPKHGPKPGRVGAADMKIASGPYCDKAWHPERTAKATVVLTCQFCGLQYARCDECEKYKPGNASACLRAHIANAHRMRAHKLAPEAKL